MIRLLCRENNLEYTGGGYLQCGRNTNCPKRTNNKILGFDCFMYMDSLPEGCKLSDTVKDGIRVEEIDRDIATTHIERVTIERVIGT